MITNAKIHGPVSNSDYMRQDVKRGDPAFVMSRSELKNFAACPSRWLAGYKSEKSAEMSWGEQLDCLLFTPEQFSRRFVVAPKFYRAPESKKKDAPLIDKPWNRNAAYCKEWEENQTGEIIKHEEADDLQAAVTKLRQDDEIRELLDCSKFQVLATATYVDDAFGIEVPINVLVDIVPDVTNRKFGKSLADLKTCSTAHPNAFEREVDKYWYDAQAFLYTAVFQAAGQDRCDFRHVLSENFAPFQVGKRYLTPEYMEVGKLKVEHALQSYCRCLHTDTWPDYEQNASQSKLRIDGAWLETAPGPYALANL